MYGNHMSYDMYFISFKIVPVNVLVFYALIIFNADLKMITSNTQSLSENKYNGCKRSSVF
jgi:hypothetical protein